jgi:toxin ParE1/3/4
MPQYALARSARADLIGLLSDTEANFGEVARQRYERLVTTALRDIAAKPDRIGSVALPAFGQGVWSYHLRHSRERARTELGIVQRPRHLLLYRHVRVDLLGVGRVLHDAMDIARHLPSEFGDE